MALKREIEDRLVAFVESLARQCRGCLYVGTRCAACDCAVARALVGEIGERPPEVVAGVAGVGGAGGGGGGQWRAGGLRERSGGSRIEARVLSVIGIGDAGMLSAEIAMKLGVQVNVVSQALIRLRRKDLVAGVDGRIRHGLASRYRTTVAGVRVLADLADRERGAA